MARLPLIQPDIDAERIARQLKGLDDRNACTLQQHPGLARMLNADHDDGIDLMAEQGAHCFLFFFQRIQVVDHDDLETCRQQRLVQRLQIFSEDNIIECGHHDTDDVAARRGKPAGGKIGHIPQSLYRGGNLVPQLF